MDINDIKILFEDNHLLVVVKPQNMPSQLDSSNDEDLLTILKEYIKDKYQKEGNVYLALVHRLDRPTGGVMVFARTSKAAERLCMAIKNGEVTKKYFAVVLNTPRIKKDRLVHFLKKNTATNSVAVVPELTEGAKRAELVYNVLESLDVISLVQIKLVTGRSHQIRVQMAAIGCPVFGDIRYGGDRLAKGFNLALWAYELRFRHPVTKDVMVFKVFPPEDKEPWKKFNMENYLGLYK